jgi:uncharacterized membrane protein
VSAQFFGGPFNHKKRSQYSTPVPKRPLAISSWYRQAVVITAIAVVAIIGLVVFLMIQSGGGKDQAQARLLSGTSDTAGVSGGLTTDSSARGLRLCNRTASRVGVAIGYKENRQWITEGWWNVAKDSCETLVAGALVSRFYYVYAVDYDQGGVWGGKAVMCTRDKMFTIRGIEDCVARGFERSGFFEVDTGEQKSWTVQLTEPGAASASTGQGG